MNAMKLSIMVFQASDAKGRFFLDLLDDDLKSIKPSYSKGGLWLKFFGHSNSLCTRASRAIIKKEFKCPCGQYPIKTRQYILHECRRFNNYWNPRWDTIAHFTLFLGYNNNTFSFGESIT